MNIRKFINNIFQLNQKLDYLVRQVEINNEVNKIIIDHFKINTTINAYEKRIISQNGEDGIIEAIFHRIGTINKYYVEFGVEDGLQCNTGYLAAFKDWSGLMIESNIKMYKKLVNNYSHLPKIKIAHHYITKDNINTVFREMNVPNEFDLLSIDIDGNDYWVWKALQDYKPRVVIIEYNASYAPSQRWIIDYDPISYGITLHISVPA